MRSFYRLAIPKVETISGPMQRISQTMRLLWESQDEFAEIPHFVRNNSNYRIRQVITNYYPFIAYFIFISVHEWKSSIEQGGY
jgi:hypothetical protein